MNNRFNNLFFLDPIQHYLRRQELRKVPLLSPLLSDLLVFHHVLHVFLHLDIVNNEVDLVDAVKFLLEDIAG